jgi:hypothetical protein
METLAAHPIQVKRSQWSTAFLFAKENSRMARLSFLSACASASIVAASLPWFGGVTDLGIIIPFGDGKCPGGCDELGARDTWVWYDATDPVWPYKMTYDGSGPQGWLSVLAVSSDPTLRNWTKKGNVLSLGPAGSKDSASASYLTTYYDAPNARWLGWYLATPTVSPPPGLVPVGPYYSMLASAPTSSGPWTQHRELGAVFPTGSPGPVMPSPQGDGTFWQFCTGCMSSLGLSRTNNLTGSWTDWLPLIVDDAVENVSLFFEQANGLWFLFTNHIGPDAGGMRFDESIWVYWSSDLTSWDPANKAVVLNRTNVIEPTFQVGRVGLPSVMQVPGNDTHLFMVYDGGGTRDNVSYNENCSVALAVLRRPLEPPVSTM